MFQFTTTNVINSAYDLTTGKSLWTTQEATDSKSASLNIKRVNNFYADNVVAIYKAEPTEADNAKVTIDLSQINGVDGDIYRLSLYIGLSQSSQDSRYATDGYYKGKPLSIEFVFNTDAATTVEALSKTIAKHEVNVYGDKILNVSYSGTYLTIEATTEYQRFLKVNIEHLDETKYHGLGEYVVVRSLSDLGDPVDSSNQVTSSAEGFFPGKEGFGTYSFLLHNLRIPTDMRTRAFAPNQDEAPIPGALYTQYTIKYCAKRGQLGLNAVGDVVKSVTNHVFYVKSDLVSQFESDLGTIGDITSVPAEG